MKGHTTIVAVPLLLLLVLGCWLVEGQKFSNLKTTNANVTLLDGNSDNENLAGLRVIPVNTITGIPGAVYYTFYLSSIQEVSSTNNTFQYNYEKASSSWKYVSGGYYQARVNLVGSSNNIKLQFYPQTFTVLALADDDWSYNGGDTLIVSFTVFSSNMNVVNNTYYPGTDNVQKTVIQGLVGYESLGITFAPNDATPYTAQVSSQPAAATISITLVGPSSDIDIPMSFQVANVPLLDPSVSVSNENLRIDYVGQTWKFTFGSITQTLPFSLEFVDITEVDETTTVVRQVSFGSLNAKWYGPYAITDSITSVLKTGQIQFPEVSVPTEIALNTFVYNEEDTVPNGNQSIALTPNSIKFTLDIYNWPFAFRSNTLQVSVSSSINPADTLIIPVNTTTPDIAATASVSRGTNNFTIDFGTQAVLDTVVQNSATVVTTNDDNHLNYTINFPAFASKLTYDPVIRLNVINTTDTTPQCASVEAEQFNLTYCPNDYTVTMTTVGKTYAINLVSLNIGDDTYDLASFSPMWTDLDQTNVNCTVILSSDTSIVFSFELDLASSVLSLSFSLSGDDDDLVNETVSLDYTITSSNTNRNYIDQLSADIPSFIFPDSDSSSLISTFTQNPAANIAANISQLPSTVIYSLALNPANATPISYQAITFSIADTRHGGGCGDARVLANSQDINIIFADEQARILFHPQHRTDDLWYTLELVSISEVTPEGQAVITLPFTWATTSCYGPYNVTKGIQYIRSNHIFPEVPDAMIVCNAFFVKQATIVENQGETISIGENTLKFDFDLRYWPFSSLANSLVLNYSISSNFNNNLNYISQQQPIVILNGTDGHDSAVLQFPSHCERDGAEDTVSVQTVQNPSSGTILITVPSFTTRLYYDPTFQIQHTVGTIVESTDDITLSLLKNRPKITLTPSVDLENVLEYYFELISISEVTTGLNPVVLQTTSDFHGAWYQNSASQTSYQGYAGLPNDIEAPFSFDTQIYPSDTSITEGEDDQFTMGEDTMGLNINVKSWPWKSQTAELHFQFRITFYRFITANSNETEVWFHKVGSNKFLDYIHIEGGVHNKKLLHLRFPRSIRVDDVETRHLGLIQVKKFDASTIDVTFKFPHFTNSLHYNPLLYIAKAATEWLLFLVVLVICCTLLLAGYAIFHKVKNYESMA